MTDGRSEREAGDGRGRAGEPGVRPLSREEHLEAIHEPMTAERFESLMGHLYRGEMSRTTFWRDRLDKTGNWSVVLVATLLTWAFSTADRPHSVILLGIVMVSIFLWIEARRYRFYDVSRSRVRMLEENVFALALDPERRGARDWRELMSEDFARPVLKVPFREAVARRLRRIYLPLFAVLLAAWTVKVTSLGASPAEVVEAAAIHRISGPWVITVVVTFTFILVALAAWPMKRRAKGELREDKARRGEWKNGD